MQDQIHKGKETHTTCKVLRLKLARWVILALVVVVASSPVLAEEFWLDEDALFGSHDDLLIFDEDALFGGGDDLLIETTSTSTRSLVDDLLVSDGIEIGGTYGLSLQSGWVWIDAISGASASEPIHSMSAEASGSLFLDARPDKDYRVFAKGRYSVDSDGDISLRLTELFSDFHQDNKVFFRAGKQTINWGVGYFFSPADIVNIGRIDPQDPTADREGPIALRANVPSGSNNYYAYLIVDSDHEGTRVAVAPKAELVVGRTEFGLGAYYRADRAPRAMATFSSTWGEVSLFGEGVLGYGTDKHAPGTIGGIPPGLNPAEEDDDRLFVQGTVGARYSWSDADSRFNLSGAAQYYYNGEGVYDSRRHYAAATVVWSEAFGSRFSPNAFWLGNLQDGSGMVSSALQLSTWDKIGVSVGISRSYGDVASEFAPLGSNTTVFLNVNLGQGSF